MLAAAERAPPVSVGEGTRVAPSEADVRRSCLLALLATAAISCRAAPDVTDAGTGGDPDATSGGPQCSGAQPTLAADVVPLLHGCSGGEICHFFGDAQSAYTELVNVASTRDLCAPGLLVAPGDPGHSYLVNKLTGVGMCPNTTRMPFGTALTDAQIQTIVDWICAGALDD